MKKIILLSQTHLGHGYAGYSQSTSVKEIPTAEVSEGSAWTDFEKWWIGNKSREKEETNIKQFENHPLLSASVTLSHSCIGVIDISSMRYLYLSPNFGEFVGTTDTSYLTEGVKWSFNRIHPDDIKAVLLFSELINKYVKGLSPQERITYHSYWDFRIRNDRGEYFRIQQRDCGLKYNDSGGMEEMMFVVTSIDNAVPSTSQHLKMTSGTTSVFYKYDAVKDAIFLLEPLSKREIEIAKRIATSQSMKKIAEQLNISFNTVKVHSANIMKKLMVNDSIEMTSVLRTWEFI